MNLNLFSICEGAFNNNGRLTIVNTYDMITSPAFPLKMPLGVAITLAFSKEDAGVRAIVLSITNEANNKEIARMESQVSIPHDDEGGFLNFASNVQGFVFPQESLYKFDLKIDGVSMGVKMMTVKQKRP